jgi:hypothetical protein
MRNYLLLLIWTLLLAPLECWQIMQNISTYFGCRAELMNSFKLSPVSQFRQCRQPGTADESGCDVCGEKNKTFSPLLRGRQIKGINANNISSLSNNS